MDSNVSAHLLEVIGLREEYELMKEDSCQKRKALEWLLKIRLRTPLSQEFGVTPNLDLEEVGGPEEWELGKYCLIAERDVPKLREAIRLLGRLEKLASIRLQDQFISASWLLPKARASLAQERQFVAGQPQLLPRRCVADSPWLDLSALGRVLMRLYPHGDGTAKRGEATMFFWLSDAPPVPFSFEVSLGESERMAPRVWFRDRTHYRLELGWPQLQEALLGIREGDSLKVTLQVLQWHTTDDHMLELTTNPADALAKTA